MAKKKDEKKDPTHDALVELRKKYGDDVVIQAQDEPKEIESIPTGCFAVDRLLGCGGLPRGRIIEISGPEASGKTFLALNVMREAQRVGYCVVYIDTEHAINRADLPKYGLDNSPEKFIIIRGNQVEELNITLTTLIEELKTATSWTSYY